MKASLYPKLALDGIRKNRRVFAPYLLTCAVMVTVYYLVLYLSTLRGYTTQFFMETGGWIIAIFSVIFLFYTHSFLMRRRKREFGLYNVLGMGKRHISLILIWENLMAYTGSLAVGLAAGIAVSKLAELALLRITAGEVTYGFSISWKSVAQTAVLFAGVFLLLLLNGLRQIRFSKTLSLLQSEAVGEKPPKANWALGILGILAIAGGYAISLTIENPVTALPGFMVAVLLVIFGTYLMLIAGSVVFCKILQKNKSYYYKPNHFVSVSSMVYRMKRNGAGLASICILVTIVLVTVSSTACLLIGGNQMLKRRYPREINVSLEFESCSAESLAAADRQKELIESACARQGVTPQNALCYRSASVSGMVQDGVVETDVTVFGKLEAVSSQDVVQFLFMPLDDYNRITGGNVTLADGEVLWVSQNYAYDKDTIGFHGGETFAIKEKRSDVLMSEQAQSILPVVVLVTPDLAAAAKWLDTLSAYNGEMMLSLSLHYDFDTGLASSKKDTLLDAMYSALCSVENYDEFHLIGSTIDTWESSSANYFELVGSLFYLGAILSAVFLMAAVLIIYYKQISEGYEDQKRFDIMRKVGMTRREIRRSINSQLLTVFFLPLVLSGIHLAFAFPIVAKLLTLFGLTDGGLLALIAAACFAVFAVFYAVVYKITSNAYYQIVAGGV